MKEKLDSISGICPTVHSDEEVSPVYSEEYDEYVCPPCQGSLEEDSDRAVIQFRNHAVRVSK